MTIWTKERLLMLAKSLPEDQLSSQKVQDIYGITPIVAAYRNFGGWRQVVEAVGRKYPGRYKWRTNRYRKNPDIFIKEVKNIPVEKIGSTHEFCREKGIERPVISSQHLCIRCREVYVPKKNKYCGECSKIVTREKTKERVKRWFANPNNRRKVNEKVKNKNRSKPHQPYKKRSNLPLERVIELRRRDRERYHLKMSDPKYRERMREKWRNKAVRKVKKNNEDDNK